MGLEVRILGLRYAAGGVEILKGVTAVSRGGITASWDLRGPARAPARAVNRSRTDRRRRILDDSPTSEMDPLYSGRRGNVFQLPALFGPRRGRDPLRGALGRKKTRRGRLLEMAGLDPLLGRRDPQTLSVGQQQRVSIARALALEPEVLLMDEPTSALDEAARRRIEDLIQELNARLELTIVLVSHALDQVERVADRVVLLAAGRSEGEWSKEEFFSGGGGERARLFISGGWRW